MDSSNLLTGFGFTQVESLLYCQLLKHSPSTAYRLAREINRQPPNVYQALSALVVKGAIVLIEIEGSPASYRPVPPRQLLASLRRDFDLRQDEALQVLEAIHAPPTDESVYQLNAATQVFEHARAMLGGAMEVVLYDMVPAIYDAVRADIEAARSRGVRVYGIAYREEDALPTVPFNGEAPTDVTDRWPGLGLILVADGREQLIAQLSRDLTGVLNAVYSDSPFLSSVLHSAVSSDIRLTALRSDPTDPLRDLTLSRTVPPGLREMRQGSPLDD